MRTFGKMRAIKELCLGLLVDEDGATAIEYALLASGIAMVIVASVMALGTQVNALFTSVNAAFK